MAIKKTLTKAEFDALPDVLKAEYKEQGDKSYKLDLDGDNSDALANENATEKAARLKAEARVKEFESAAETQARELDEARVEAARVAGDLKTVEGSWQKKLDDANKLSAAQVNKYKDVLVSQLVDGAASKLAAELNPKLSTVWLPHIKARLVADFEGEAPRTVVLGKDGKPSEMTIADLKTEFLANADFKSIITVSQASGGRTKDTQTQHQNTDNSVDLASMSPRALAAHLDANKADTTQE